ncbi:SusC/RagA family TonB-linked outer membrane protein [Sphingobacteruim zhuxiongii]|nr:MULTISPECIES: TonB-dependent receptor [unclassified Sphingobacterium]
MKSKVLMLKKCKWIVCQIPIYISMATVFTLPNTTLALEPNPARIHFEGQDQITVKGTVVNQQSVPITGATVRVIDMNNVVSTDGNGQFTIAAKEGSILEITFMGYKKATISVKNSNDLNIVLIPDDNSINEVVVVGYGTNRKGNLTGAVSSVSSEAIEGRSIANVGQGLQGLIPNLNVSTGNGRPGSGSSFNLRGYTSINGGGPLVLVDGVQMDPNQLNPDDVESVTVLKDAASAAIYGGRAAYGVILINTKAGKYNAPTKVSYNLNQAYSKPTVLPDLANSLEYVTMYMLADNTGRLTGGATGSYGYNDQDLEHIRKYMANPIPENAVYIDPTDHTRYRYSGNTNWLKEMFPGNEPLTQHDFSISGGGEKLNYLASLGALSQKGAVSEANQKYKRYNANMVVNFKAASWLELSTKMRFNRKTNDQPAEAARYGIVGDRIADDLRPVMPIYHPDGHYSGQGNNTNPFANLEYNGRNTLKSDDLWLTGGFVIKPIKNVRVVGDLTWNAYHQNNKSNVKPYYEYGAPAIKGDDITDPTKAHLIGLYPHNNPSSVYEANSHDNYSAINLYAEYENTFGKHYLKGMVGYNREYKVNESFNVRAKNLLNPDYPYIKLNNDLKPDVGSGIGDWALIGQFFRVNYVYDDRYLLEVNGRYDGSSRFAASDRYVFSPSISAGWRLSNEAFMDFTKPLFNDIKLRASYGKLPNQLLENKGLYPYIATMPYGTTGYLFNGSQQTFVRSPSLVSQGFTWEEVTSRNIGLDIAMLDSKLKGSFDVYNRDTKGMIVGGLVVPSILGTNVPERNAADLRTKGWELELSWADNLSNGLRYFASVNVGDSKAEITKYDLNPTGIIGQYYVGSQIGEVWGFTSNRLYSTDAEAASVDNSAIWGGKWLAGDVKYEDLNGDGKINYGTSTFDNPGDRRIIGNNQARYNYGFRLGAEFKNFDLTMFFQGIGKRDAFIGGTYFWGFTSEWAAPTTASLDYWTEENQDAYFPRPRFGGGGNYQTQTRYMQDASYLRMKQLSVGYTLPASLLQRLKLTKVRAYFTAENPFQWTKMFESYDPEQLDRQEYPLVKSLAFGLQINL